MDLSVTDFNVRLRTIRLREVILAAIIAFNVAMVIVVFLPMFEGFEEYVFAIFMVLLILFFAWALRGTHGLKDNFSQIFEREYSREILYVLIINFIFAMFIVSFFATIHMRNKNCIFLFRSYGIYHLVVFRLTQHTNQMHPFLNPKIFADILANYSVHFLR